MTTYTKISKPNTPSYTKVSYLPTFDDLNTLYDDPNVNYDGVNLNMYTKISKPNTPSYTKVSKPI